MRKNSSIFKYFKKEKASSRKFGGFTLLELLLYLGVLAFVILVVSSLFVLFLSSRAKNETVADVEQQGIQVMQIITQTIRNAKSINYPFQGATANSISLKVDTNSLDPTVFDLSSGEIRITEGTGSPISLTSSAIAASGLTFTNLSKSIKIQFTLTRVNLSGRNEYNYAKTFYGSAKTRP